MVHGFGREGMRCAKDGCTGVLMRYARTRKKDSPATNELRCSECKIITSARGGFFAHYPDAQLKEQFQLLYAVAHRWRPSQVMDELKIRGRDRFVAMINHSGAVCSFYLSLLFKSSIGKWTELGADEAATGQAKKAASGKAKRPTKKGLRWWISVVNFRTLADGTRKALGFFYEYIPVLAVVGNNGETKYKCKTAEHLCWHVQRLGAWGAKFISDSAKGYQRMGEIYRPDMEHEDSNHNKGFAAPGKKSIEKGLQKCDTNIIEGGGHGTLYKLIRPWLGRKIGSGKDEYEQRVKDVGVAMVNWGFQGKDTLQELLLWMRYMYGSMHPTTLEINLCHHLNLTINNAPDYSTIEKQFEDIDLHKEPWEFMVGPELPPIRKYDTTKPEHFYETFAEYWELKNTERRLVLELADHTENPPAFQLPLDVPLADLTAPFRPQQPKPARPKGQSPMPRRRFAPVAVGSDGQFRVNPADLDPEFKEPPVFKTEPTWQAHLPHFGFQYEPAPKKARLHDDDSGVSFRPHLSLGQLQLHSDFGFEYTPAVKKEPQSPISISDDDSAVLRDLTNTNKPNQEAQSRYKPSPPGGAVSFHPSLLCCVIDEHGQRQRRLSEVGIARSSPPPADLKEESSRHGELRAKENSPDPREESSRQGELRGDDSGDSDFDLTEIELAVLRRIAEKRRHAPSAVEWAIQRAQRR